MKRILFCVIALFCVAGNVLAYDLYSGGLYYNIVDGNAQVTCPLASPYYYTACPTGDLIIPSSVTYNGTTYYVTSIGKNAFYGCSGLTSITIPAYVTSIGETAFHNCSGLTSVYYAGDVAGWCGIDFDGSSSNPLCYAHNLYINNTLVTNIVIPNSVTEIKQYAFHGATCLTSLTIGNSVTSIGDRAVCSCSGLTSVTIGNSVTSIGESAFYGCSGLASVYYTGDVAGWCGIDFYLSEKSNPLFYAHNLYINNTLVTDLVIPNSVTEIKQCAFYGATCLTSVTIPTSVISIGRVAFAYCSGLTSVYYTGNITGWCGIDFDGSSSNPLFYAHNLYINNTLVTNLVIPNSVTEIKQYGFAGATCLTSLSIHNLVTSINSGAFYSCNAITEIHSLNPVPPQAIRYSSLDGVPTNIPVYIPCGSLSAYSSATGWSNFTNFIESGSPSFSAVSENDVMGSVQILSMPTCSDPQAEVIASANSGYQFDHWSDNSTANPYTLNVTDDMVLTAYFSPVTTYYTITVTSNNDAMGTVSGGGSFAENTTATITATAYSGYQFDHWQDGNTSNPRTITVLSDATYTAYFATNTTYYTINVVSSDATMGSVTGGGSYVSSTTVTLIATPNSGYRFDHWQDGSTANPRTITVTGNATYTAYFEVNQPSSYTIFADCNNPIWGSVTGGGTYTMNSVITLNAIANNGYRFVHWQDGNTENPRTITVTGNATYIAYFEANPITSYYTISVLSSDPNMGAADGSGVYAAGSTATISATANEGYHFVQWQDGNIMNPRTITVTADAEYIAYFVADVTNEYTITVMSQNPTMGSTTGSGTFAYGTVTTITAEPYNGYHFVQWQDGNTQRIRTITVTGNATYTAYFDGSNGIDDVETADNIKIYTRGNTIVIDFSGQQVADSRQSVVVYDIMGRVIKQAAGSGQQAAVEIPVTSARVYMVKVGEQPSRKVVVR